MISERSGLVRCGKTLLPENVMPNFKIEVRVEHEWAGNAIILKTREEAEAYGKDLLGRWFAVTALRVLETEEPVNYTFQDGKLTKVTS